MVLTRNQARKMAASVNSDSQTSTMVDVDFESENEIQNIGDNERSSGTVATAATSEQESRLQMNPLERIMFLLEQQQRKFDEQQKRTIEFQNNLETKLKEQHAEQQQALKASTQALQNKLEEKINQATEKLNKQYLEIQEQLAERDSEWETKLQERIDASFTEFTRQHNSELQEQVNNVCTVVQGIQQAYQSVPQTLTSLETEMKDLSSAKSTIELNIQELTTRVHQISIGNEEAIKQHLQKHEQSVVGTFNEWLRQKDSYITETVEKELPRAIHQATQQIASARTETSESLKIEVEQH